MHCLPIQPQGVLFYTFVSEAAGLQRVQQAVPVLMQLADVLKISLWDGSVQ